jgi:hypothetical protein
MRRRARSESDLFSPCGIIASKKRDGARQIRDWKRN